MQFDDRITSASDKILVLRYHQSRLESLREKGKLGAKGHAELDRIITQIAALQSQL